VAPPPVPFLFSLVLSSSPLVPSGVCCRRSVSPSARLVDGDVGGGVGAAGHRHFAHDPGCADSERRRRSKAASGADGGTARMLRDVLGRASA
jgi:hypothetical protein